MSSETENEETENEWITVTDVINNNNDFISKIPDNRFVNHVYKVIEEIDDGKVTYYIITENNIYQVKNLNKIRIK